MKELIPSTETPTLKKDKEKPQVVGLFNRPISEMYEFYISGYIGPSEQYTTLFQQIRNLGELDFVKIHINSFGGDLFTAIQFMRVLKETSATVICSMEGACFSAATIIFLCGQQYEISPHSAMMIHTYSGGMIGKGQEIYAQSVFERQWSVELIRTVYEGFLTPEEIESVIAGSDLWLSDKDVVKRLEKLAEYNLKKKKVEAKTEGDAVQKALKRKGKAPDPTA